MRVACDSRGSEMSYVFIYELIMLGLNICSSLHNKNLRQDADENKNHIKIKDIHVLHIIYRPQVSVYDQNRGHGVS